MNRGLLRTFGYGTVIYACTYLFWSLFSEFDTDGTTLSRVCMLAVVLFVTLVCTRTLHATTWRDALPYSTSWVLTIALYDALFAWPTNSWLVFAVPDVWVGYGLVLLAPLIAPRQIVAESEPIIA